MKGYLPCWFIKLVTEERDRLKSHSEDTSQYLESRFRCDVAYRRLNWVLSLKSPSEKEGDI